MAGAVLGGFPGPVSGNPFWCGLNSRRLKRDIAI